MTIFRPLNGILSNFRFHFRNQQKIRTFFSPFGKIMCLNTQKLPTFAQFLAKLITPEPESIFLKLKKDFDSQKKFGGW